MRQIIITTIISGMIVAIAATFGVLRYTQASTVTPYDADVDHDGHISILDLSNVARYYGQSAPLPVATTTPPTIVGNRAFAVLNPLGHSILVNTDDGSIVADFGNVGGVVASSCDGARAAMDR